MATFGKATFNAASYAVSRPTYPRALFDYIFRFHGADAGASANRNRARWDTAIDLGCGTGQATVELTPFKHVIGVDPSAGMVDAALRALSESASDGQSRDGSAVSHPTGTTGRDAGSARIRYVQSPAERLAFLSDGSVDLMISAQAGHWFDWPRMWPEAARVLRTDGTIAIWTYSELRLPRYPSLTPGLTHFFQGTDRRTSIGPYWQQPGRSILENHLVAVPDANDVVPGAFKDMTRCYFTGSYYPHLPSPKPVLMRKRMSWHALYGFFRTSSALHTFLEQNPEDAVHPEGDLAMRFWKSLLSGASAQDGQPVQPEEEVEVEWPLALILAKRA